MADKDKIKTDLDKLEDVDLEKIEDFVNDLLVIKPIDIRAKNVVVQIMNIYANEIDLVNPVEFVRVLITAKNTFQVNTRKKLEGIAEGFTPIKEWIQDFVKNLR